jgi:hypothetical protein
MENRTFKAGDKVKVWSLQSWSGGGFLNGKEAIVRQDQGSVDSVLLIVDRMIGGREQTDHAYEVYARQCELIEPGVIREKDAISIVIDIFEKLIKELKTKIK